MLNFYLQF